MLLAVLWLRMASWTSVVKALASVCEFRSSTTRAALDAPWSIAPTVWHGDHRPIRKGEEVCFLPLVCSLPAARSRRATLAHAELLMRCERCGIHRDEQRAWRLLEEAAAAASESKPRLPPPLDGGTNARVHALQRTALMAMDQELSPLMPERAELIANLHYFGGGGGGPAGSVHEASHEEDVRKKETETSEQTRVAEAAAAPFEIRPLHELLSGLREEAALPSGAWRHPSVSLLPAAEPPPPLSSWPPVLRHASLHAALFTWMPALNLLALALAGCCLWACVRSISADGVAEMGVASEMYDALLSPVGCAGAEAAGTTGARTDPGRLSVWLRALTRLPLLRILPRRPLHSWSWHATRGDAERSPGAAAVGT